MLGLYDTRDQHQDRPLNEERALAIVAKVPLIVAYYHRARQGLDLVPIRQDLNEAGHFLYLISGKEPGVDATRTLDVAYILHADHGMNASTFSARVTIATLSDMYSAITSAIGTLKGPLHGGANEGVIKMLNEIGDEDKVDACVEERLAKKKKDHGHRSPRLQGARPPCAAPAQDGHQAHRGARRDQMDRHVRAHCRNHARAQGPQRQCRFLLGHRLLLARHSDRSVYADLCDFPRGQLAGLPKSSSSSTTIGSTVR